MANGLLTRLREAVAASSEPQLQRGGGNPEDRELEEGAPSQAERDKAAENGDAFTDGKYPITTQTQADNAWKLRNSSKEHSEASVIAHIRKQVKKHNLQMPGTTRESDNHQAHALGRILLREARAEKKPGGAYEVTVVREGPGNPSDANYYTKQALREAVNRNLFEGLQAYLNHPTPTEERERPERDVRYLAGHFREARYVDGSPAEVRAKFIPGGMDKDRVISLIESALQSPKNRPLIGISIDGYGHAPDTQDVNGRTYNMVREVTNLGSADIVARTDAGGAFHRRLQEAWRDTTGTASRRPETSKEAHMNPAKLQEQVKAALAKLSEAAALKDEDEKAGALIDEGMTALRECAHATLELPAPEVKIQEKLVEVPVAAKDGEKADELAAQLKATETKLTEATTARDTAEQARKDAEDKLAANDAAKLATKVLREANVPEKPARSWFDDIVAAGDETAMKSLVQRRMDERESIIAEFRETAGIEGAGARQPLRESSPAGDSGLLGRLDLNIDDYIPAA